MRVHIFSSPARWQRYRAVQATAASSPGTCKSQSHREPGVTSTAPWSCTSDGGVEPWCVPVTASSIQLRGFFRRQRHRAQSRIFQSGQWGADLRSRARHWSGCTPRPIEFEHRALDLRLTWGFLPTVLTEKPGTVVFIVLRHRETSGTVIARTSVTF